MELAIDWLSFAIYKFECVRAITIHVTIAIRDATIREQERNLVSGLGPQTNEIPKHVRVLLKGEEMNDVTSTSYNLKMSNWITLLSVNEAWELREGERYSKAHR